MSWLDKVQNKMIITTGDGLKWQPNWIAGKIKQEYNVSVFDFPNVRGSFVDRRMPRGLQYELVIYFQGEMNIETQNDFLKSAENTKYWTLEHPLYDIIYVQPIGLEVDNTGFNVSKITIQLIETITDVNPKLEEIIEDDLNLKVIELLESITTQNLAVSDISNIKDTNLDIYNSVLPDVENPVDSSTLLDKLHDANNALNNAIADVNTAMQKTLNFVNTPSMFIQSVKSKINILKANYEKLKSTLKGGYSTLVDMPNSLKNMFENMGLGILTGLAIGSTLPQSEDYKNRTDVAEVIDILLDIYSDYLENMDNLQVGNGNNPTDFIANSNNASALNEIMFFAIGNLYIISLAARQERTFYTQEDTDFISLTHQLYGLKSDDSTIDELINNNNLGLNGILNIKKDTPITYYV